MSQQQGDVLLFQTRNNGEINVEGGIVEMTGDFDTAAYLSLFGGNEDDPAGSVTEFSWWGNIGETEPSRRYRSETQYLTRSIPATSNNLLRIEDAARRDLQWMLDENIASSITVSASIPELNRLRLDISIQAIGLESNFKFVENWKSAT